MRKLVNAIIATWLTAILSLMGTNAASSETARKTCYGASCIGLNPYDFCGQDAITVAYSNAEAPGAGYAGLLELRYSPSCAANWGRFTITDGTFFGDILDAAGVGSPTPLYGRLTVWNPGEPSQPHIAESLDSKEGSIWTYMVDGTKKACVGVEPFYLDAKFGIWASKKYHSGGWIWGPCM